jgi:hypothetical protein
MRTKKVFGQTNMYICSYINCDPDQVFSVWNIQRINKINSGIEFCISFNEFRRKFHNRVYVLSAE